MRNNFSGGIEMKSFYQYILTFRGEKQLSEIGRLAEWVFQDESFPKQSCNYREITDYLEWTSPYVGALQIFDEVWNRYEEHYKQDSF